MVTHVDIHNIDQQFQIVEDAIMIQKNEAITREVAKLIEAISAFPGPRKDLENRLELLLKTLPEADTSVQETLLNPPMISDPIGLELATSLPPAGIERDGCHCPENSMAQLLNGAPALIPECLRSIMNKVQSARVNRERVGDTFGPEFRKSIGELLQSDYSLSRESQNDVLAPLSHIIEKAGQEIHYQRSVERKDGTSYGHESDTMIRLDMSSDQPFLEKLEKTFHTEIEGEIKKSLKFTETPRNIVIAANRQIHSASGVQQKIASAIQGVPEQLVVNPELSVNGQGALYSITGCIIHTGTDDGGHYTTLRKIEDTWYHIDDADVQKVKNPEKYLSQGYVFHYQKIEQPEISYQASSMQVAQTEIEEEASFTCYDLLKSIWASVWNPFEVIDAATRSKKDV